MGVEGSNGREAARRALLRLLDDTEADFLISATRPPGAEMSVMWSVVAPESAPSHLAAYWHRVGPRDLPGIESALDRNPVAQAVDPDTLSTLEQHVLDGSPVPVGALVAAPITHGAARVGSLSVIRTDSSRTWTSIDLQAVEAGAALLAACTQAAGSSVDRSQAIEEAGRALHRTHVLAEAARILSTDPSDAALERVLDQVVDATDTSVFVEINGPGPDGEPCIHLAADAAHDGGYVCQTEYWDGMPWSRMPQSRSRLEQGMSCIVRRGALSGVEAETYAASRVGSELDVPIFTGDEWVGLVGLLSEDEQRDWSRELPLMQTLGSLLGARFERTGLPPTGET